ncbi:hypothetical protein SRHO_G00207920 [Serrasalmus rhombeus]
MEVVELSLQPRIRCDGALSDVGGVTDYGTCHPPGCFGLEFYNWLAGIGGLSTCSLETPHAFKTPDAKAALPTQHSRSSQSATYSLALKEKNPAAD